MRPGQESRKAPLRRQADDGGNVHHVRHKAGKDQRPGQPREKGRVLFVESLLTLICGLSTPSVPSADDAIEYSFVPSTLGTLGGTSTGSMRQGQPPSYGGMVAFHPNSPGEILRVLVCVCGGMRLLFCGKRTIIRLTPMSCYLRD